MRLTTFDGFAAAASGKFATAPCTARPNVSDGTRFTCPSVCDFGSSMDTMKSNVSPTWMSGRLVATVTAIATGGCRSPLIVSPPIIAFMLLIICSCIRSISSKRSRACACATSGSAATSATHASARTIRPSAPTTRNTTAKKPTVQPTRPFHAWRSTGRPSCRHIGSSTAALSCLRASAATMPRSMTGVCPVRHSSAE